MPYINSMTKEFMPQLKLEDDWFLKVFYKMNLVCIRLTSDLKWDKHINYTVSRVNKVIWQLARFKQLGAPREKLKTLCILKIRSILMFGAACYRLHQRQLWRIRVCLTVLRTFRIIPIKCKTQGCPSFVRTYVPNAQGTLPGFRNGVDWRYLVQA